MWSKCETVEQKGGEKQNMWKGKGKEFETVQQKGMENRKFKTVKKGLTKGFVW